MPKIIITRDEQGHLVGFGEKHARAYARFKKRVVQLEHGELLSFEWREPRCPKFHALFFVMLNHLFDMQEQFADVDDLRTWLTTAAGFCHYCPGPKGKLMAIPQSIAFDRLEEPKFKKLVRGVWKWLRSDEAQQFLWPQTPRQQRVDGVEQLLIGWDG